MKKSLLVLLLSTGLYASEENDNDRPSFEDTATGPGYTDYDSDNDTELPFLLSTGAYASQENNKLPELNLDFLNENTSKDLDKDINSFLTKIEHELNEEDDDEDIDSLLVIIQKDIIDQQNPPSKKETSLKKNRSHKLPEYEKHSNPRNKRKKIYTDRNPTSNSNKKSYQCAQCDKSFAQNAHSTEHIRTHTGEKPYQCTQCDKCFAVNGNLTKHMLTHTGEKPYQCTHEGCNYSTIYKHALITHIRTHTAEKPHQCTQCDQRFTQNSTLKRHMKAIHKNGNANDSEHEEDPSN